MLRIALQPVIAFVILVAGLAIAGPAAEEKPELEWGKEVEGCRLAVTPPRSSFRTDQPVQLRITTRNLNDHAVLTVRGNLILACRYDVRLPNGKRAPLTLEGDRQAALTDVRARSEKLDAGESDTFTVTLSRLYDMTLRGEYTVTVYRQVGMPRTDTKKRLKWVEIPSQTLKFVIRDDPPKKPDEE